MAGIGRNLNKKSRNHDEANRYPGTAAFFVTLWLDKKGLQKHTLVIFRNNT